MPLPGGETDKIGNRYEGRWTVFCMIDVMDEKADSIRLETPGEDAFEFFVRRNGKLECHQVKRQKGGRGRWTLSALQDKQVQVLSDFWKSLSNPDVSCVFVSTQDADELGELANRARSAASWTEFERDFLNKTQFGHFNTLRQKWRDCSEIAAFEALKRVSVETVGEDFLVSTIESRLAALVEGDPKTIRIELAELALERIHQELTAHDIWHYLLHERKYRRRQWGNDPHVLAAVETANNLYFSSLHDTQAIAGDVIPRDETQIAFEELTERKQSILLEGEAGVGKSGVMLQVLEKLHNQGFPVLTFRVDRLEPTLLPDNVGQQLGLPGSPAIVLANIAQKRDCVLVIDQLDAVSLASGRNPQFFDCVAEIIKQAQAHSNIRVLLACRKFDLENDNRLKRLGGEKGIARLVTINRLAHSTVREVVGEKLGLDATRLGEKQLNLLSVPLHLGLLAEIAEDATINALNFQTAKELYDQFWKYKNNRLRERLGRSVQWTQVIDALCDYMSSQQQQSLSAPERVVDEFEHDAKAMASEHLLILEGKRISFFHESFFDYAFARRFASRGHKLLPFLGRREEQHLFRRAQVRQILLHEREEDFNRYLDNLKELLTSPDIRFHIKQVVFALLATLNDPKEEEWNIIAALIGNHNDPVTQQVWRTLYSSVNWFKLLDFLGVIQQWLRDTSEERVEQAIRFLSIMQKQVPDKVADLAEPFVGTSTVWSMRLAPLLLQFAKFSHSRRLFELFLGLIDTGILDDIGGDSTTDRDFWSLIYTLPKQKPEWACEAISLYLNRWLNLSVSVGQNNPFSRNSGTLASSNFYHEVLTESAEKAPQAFIQKILPFILKVINLTAIHEGNRPWNDAVWQWRMYGDSSKIKDVLLSAFESSLSKLAKNDPEYFINEVEQQLLASPSKTIEYLLIRAYTANGKIFVDAAINYLHAQPTRLETGYLAGQGNVSAAPFWATRQLLVAIIPYCSSEHLEKLELLILNYYPAWEMSYEYRTRRGYAQFVLLDAIHNAQISKLKLEFKIFFINLFLLEPTIIGSWAKVALQRFEAPIQPYYPSETITRRLYEWQRKFGETSVEAPKSMVVSFVGSPIPEPARQKMTDKHWLKAIRRYDRAAELSDFLEAQVKKEPARFAALVANFPDDTNSLYFDAVLRGITEVGIDVRTAFCICQRCHQLPQRPCGKSIAWLFEKLADLPWTVSALDILLCYALNDPNPEQELWRTQTPSGQVDYGDKILTAGMNSTRGRAVSAIAKLIFADKNRASYFQIPMQQIVRDPSIAVRCYTAEALTAMLNYDRNLAVSLFLKLCETEDALLETCTVEHFLYYAIPTHFQQLTPILERMITSNLPEVVRVGARQACLSSLAIEEARSFAERCLSGTDLHRISAAEIFVANLRTAHLREFCETALTQLFNDPDEKVREQAAKCFFKLEGEELSEYVNLAEAFVNSRAFESDCSYLIDALKKTTAKLPDITCLVCEKFINSFGLASADIRTHSAVDASEVSELLIRVYSQSKDETMRSRCLDLVDRMIQMGAYGLDQALQQFER
ncbi:hypothetical protein [uncultured Nostoc sp.]|uniref:hypothetical protein n=1 Tax=uncultured Nostoc sp. TaxID=340711 RepID=UPI0035CB7240